MRYFFDTEFMEDGKTIDLISIGVVCEDGREFYAENVEADHSKANEWVRENVLPHLWSRQVNKRDANLWSRDGGTGGLLPRSAIARSLIGFVADGNTKPEFWAYYGDYDWVVLCQLYGRMIDLPASWPMFALDIKQYAVSLGNPELPAQESQEHNALEDARWNQQAFSQLQFTQGGEWSGMSVGGRRLTWKEAFESERKRRNKAEGAATILSDLDRCEHGRHETDDCFSCKDEPVLSARGTQMSKGNLFLKDRRLGTALSGKAIVMPEGDDRYDFTRWYAP